jgi:CheY-like chemotaxis protein
VDQHNETDGSRGQWRLRTEFELVADQLAGMEAYHRSRALRAAAAVTVQQTREMRLDLQRRAEALRAEQRALQESAARHLAESARLLSVHAAPRAVLAHRNAWLRGKLVAALSSQGVEVVAELEDGAEAVGVVVAEQPELLLVEDRLPGMPGLQVLKRSRAFAPHTQVAAQLLDSTELHAYVSGGARAVFTRRTPPADIAMELVRCLRGDPGRPSGLPGRQRVST